MIKPLTSLRFFFALIVFLHHIQFVPESNVLFIKLYNNILYEGYLGVSFFFILSGFILALNYKNKLLSNNISFKEFWIARIARIYPMHLITLIIVLPLYLCDFWANSILWIAKFLSNCFLVQSFIPAKFFYFSFNGPSWSISDEMFFYLLFPFILWYFKYPKARYISLILLLFIPIVIYFSPEHLKFRLFYINPLFRIADFITGILLYNIYERYKKLKWLNSKLTATLIEFASISLFFLFFAFHRFIPQGYRYSCYYWIPMLMIILVFSYQSGYLSGILSKRVFVLLGEISFSFYLIHQLLINYIVNFNTKFMLINNEYILIVVILILSLILSYISYVAIELPSNKYIKARFTKVMATKKI